MTACVPTIWEDGVTSGGSPKFEKECAQWKQQPEDVLTYALFPQVAVDFFKYRQAQQTGVDPAKGDKKDKSYPL